MALICLFCGPAMLWLLDVTWSCHMGSQNSFLSFLLAFWCFSRWVMPHGYFWLVLHQVGSHCFFGPPWSTQLLAQIHDLVVGHVSLALVCHIVLVVHIGSHWSKWLEHESHALVPHGCTGAGGFFSWLPCLGLSWAK